MPDKPGEQNKKIPLEDIKKQIEDYRSKGDVERLKILEGLYLIRSAKTGFIKREKDRLVKKFGPAHPRIQRYINKEKNNMLVMQNLRQELIRSKIDFSAFDKDSWNICGHIRDSEFKPVQNLVVQFFDEGGELVEKLKSGRTDMTGFFTIIISSKKLEAAEIAESTKLYIRIFDKKKNLLFKDPNPLFCRIGQVDYREIILPKGSTPSPQPKPSTPDEPPPSTTPGTPPGTPPITPPGTPPGTPSNAASFTPPRTPVRTPPSTPPSTPLGTPRGIPPGTPPGTAPFKPPQTPVRTPPSTPPSTPLGTPPRTTPSFPPQSIKIRKAQTTTKPKPDIIKKSKPPPSPPISPTKKGPTIDEWIIKGSVMDEKGNPLEGITVSPYDNKHIFDDYLGSTVTDNKGRYKFTYKAQGSREFFEKKPDVFLKITDKKGNILSIPQKRLKCIPGTILTHNIKIKPETKTGETKK